MLDYQQCFEFLRYSISPDKQYAFDTKNLDWYGLYRFAKEQAILGVLFEGVKRFGEQNIKPPFELLIQWIATAEQIEGRNKSINKAVLALFEKLNNDGLRGCVLKGQGNNLMYPYVYARTPGDIDIWINRGIAKARICGIKEIVRYVRQHNPEGKACYHHIDYGLFNGIEVEVHYRPSFMFNPIHNHRLQKWYNEHAEEQFQHQVELPKSDDNINVPTLPFNIVFLLSHVYNHLLHEGIGLRQVIDYYYLLRNAKDKLKIENGELIITLRYLGLEKIAGAVMWVLHEVLGLEKQYLIVPMDEKRGKVLFTEILKGGNFGQYNEEVRSLMTGDSCRSKIKIIKNILRLKRDFRLMRYFPSECLWEPLFRMYHFFWRLRYN